MQTTSEYADYRGQESDVLPPMKLLLTVDEAANALGVWRTFLYTKLLQTGEVFSLKVEGRRLVPVQALHEYVARIMISQKAS